MIIEQEITEDNYEEMLEQDRKLTERKFETVRSFGNLSSSNKHVNEKFGKLMRDPTCWAYAFLKDKMGNPLKMYPFQDRLINDKSRFVMGIAANQTGKTLGMCVKALHHALYVPNAFVLIVSRSEDQATRILDEIKWFMRFGIGDFESIKDEVDNRMELHIKSKGEKGVAVIKCVPPTTSALGIPATLIICDEMGFWEIKSMPDINYFYQVLETRTLSTKNWKHDFLTMGQICIISNPNGQRGLLWHLYKEDSRFSIYRFSWLAKPENTIEEYLQKKKVLPHDIFDSSYAAVFSSAAGSFITEDEYNDSIRQGYDFKIPRGTQLFLGGDFAGEDTHSRSVDLTALIGVIRIPTEHHQYKIRMVYYNVYPPRTKKNVIYDEIRKLTKKNSIIFAYDKVGVGDSVRNDLKERGILSDPQIHSLTYSLPNKSEVYWNLKHLFEQRKIELRDMPKLKEEVTGLQFTRTGGGYMTNGIMQSYIKVHHSTEKIHDDIADALANACYIANRLSTPDYEYMWIPSKEEPVRDYSKKRAEKIVIRVMCDKCGEDWDYDIQETCYYCPDAKVLDYATEKPIESIK